MASRWRGWRTELVGLRACFWLGLAVALEWVEHGLHRLVTRATRRYTRRAHEYDVRCRTVRTEAIKDNAPTGGLDTWDF